jgi:2-methylcitrate dehydratase PrpD
MDTVNAARPERAMVGKRWLSEALADFVVDTQYDAIPPQVLTWAKLLILDTIGNAYASSRCEFAQIAVKALQRLDAGEGRVIGMPEKLTLRDVVLMNGILVHGLDFDDTYLPGAVHLTASCVPTTLALAARSRASGKDMLTACILGLEAGMRLAGAANGGILRYGFHPTSVCGAFASVLAASKLMRLSHAHTVMAQGLVLSSASGTMQPTQEGAWAKRMHPGLMGSAAITAAALAQQGFTGSLQAYEGNYGLFTCFLGQYAGNADIGMVTQELGTRWECLRTSIKLFPACYQSHAAMNAALELRRDEAIDAAAIESIRVRVGDAAVPLVCEPLAAKRKPDNSYAAQFSLP